MSRPTLGVVIPTPGRRSIFRTLNSIKAQGLEPGDDILIVGDGFHKPTAGLVEMMGPPFRYIATTKTRDWGHSQFNYGVQHVRGDWVTGQDDDDIYLPRAFDSMREIVATGEPRVILGRVMSPYLGILWTEPQREPLDGHCILVPNDKKKLGCCGVEYAGDQVWIQTSLAAYESYTWADRVWTLTRPVWQLWCFRVNEYLWHFHRTKDGLWDTSPTFWLHLEPAGDHMRANYGVTSPECAPTMPEACELAEFAAYAGQGSDVWFEHHGTYQDEMIAPGLLATGYVEHESTATFKDYTHTWPPRRFVPDESLKDKVQR